MVESIITIKTIHNNNINCSNNNNNNRNININILLAICMLLLGYILGSITNNNNHNHNDYISSNNGIHNSNDDDDKDVGDPNHHHQHQIPMLLFQSNINTMIAQFVDVIIVPIYIVVVVLYILLRLTILKGKTGGGIFIHYDIKTKQRQQKSKVGTSKDQQQQQVSSTMAVLNDSETTCQRINMTGGYQLIENHNFDELLQVQGVPWALRKAVSKLRPIHRFIHSLETNQLTIKIEGIIETQTSYQIGGPPISSEVRGRKFYDTLEYIHGGIQTYKQAIDDGYTVTIQRILSNNKQKLTMTSIVNFDHNDNNNDDSNNNKSEPVKAIQIFERLIEEEGDLLMNDDDEREHG